MIPDVSIYRDRAATKTSGTHTPSVAENRNGGFVKTIVLLIVVLILLQVAGVDLSSIAAMAAVAVRFLWELFTVLFSFFIEIIKQAIEALRNVAGMRG